MDPDSWTYAHSEIVTENPTKKVGQMIQSDRTGCLCHARADEYFLLGDFATTFLMMTGLAECGEGIIRKRAFIQVVSSLSALNQFVGFFLCSVLFTPRFGSAYQNGNTPHSFLIVESVKRKVCWRKSDTANQ